MDAKQFVSSIYLGDRACKGISIDSWSQEVSVQVDVISRIRSGDGCWNFYNDENIENGSLVFTKARKILFDPCGLLPNDYINSLEVIEQDDGACCFVFSICSVSTDAQSHEMIIKIIAESIGIRDPMNPNTLIVD